MPKKKKQSHQSKSPQLTAAQLQEAAFHLFAHQPKKRLSARAVIRELHCDNNVDAVQHALERLAEAGKLLVVDERRFQLNRTALLKSHSVEGRVDMTRSGSAYIISEESQQDIFVPAKHLNSALGGDRVRVEVVQVPGRRSPEGRVTDILERASVYFIGTIRISKRYAFVIPDRLDMPVDIYVPAEHSQEARDGDKVVVKIVKWPQHHNQSPEGRITSVLGAAGGNDIEMKAILINNGFNLEFPEDVLAEAAQLHEDFSEAAIAERRDMRTVPTFTIDPEDAKDFDDALSYRRLDDGRTEVGVHIADVAHYVQPGTALDEEAYKRSTSVYLVDRVLPMLPEKLSNELCSLRPHEDKMTFSAVFTFDADDRLVERWFGRTVTHSDHRFSYEAAQAVLEGGEGPFSQELHHLNRIAHKLRKARFSQGAINFEADEVRFRLDEQGVPLEVFVKTRKDAHLLIEDFMLLANREVATYIHKKAQDQQEIPFIYRVHDLPDEAKLEDFARFAAQLGLALRVDTPQHIAKSFNTLAKRAQEDETFKVLAPLAIRTMAKAAYSSENIGHYGLAFEHYTHFTSPIRRYSDVLAHRIFFNNLDGRTQRVNKADLENKCRHISTMERRAMDAERESMKYKQVEYISKRLGEAFEGVVTGMMDRGIFIELKDNHCEGRIGFDTMPEAFDITDSRLVAKGRRSGRIIKIGDTLRVRIANADLSRRQIDMVLDEEA